MISFFIASEPPECCHPGGVHARVCKIRSKFLGEFVPIQTTYRIFITLSYIGMMNIDRFAPDRILGLESSRLGLARALDRRALYSESAPNLPSPLEQACYSSQGHIVTLDPTMNPFTNPPSLPAAESQHPNNVRAHTHASDGQ